MLILSLGIKIELLDKGSNATPKPGQRVTANYNLTLEDGTKIDSSYDRGKAFEFTVGKGQVIRGWDEGIQKVTLGSKVRLTISPVRCLVII